MQVDHTYEYGAKFCLDLRLHVVAFKDFNGDPEYVIEYITFDDGTDIPPVISEAGLIEELNQQINADGVLRSELDGQLYADEDYCKVFRHPLGEKFRKIAEYHATLTI